MALVVAVVVMAASAPHAEAAMGCGTVVRYLGPCLPYVRNRGGLGQCCVGVRGLYRAARTTRDRQTVCGCLKSFTGYGVNFRKAAVLPRICRVYVPYPISPNTHCSRVR